MKAAAIINNKLKDNLRFWVALILFSVFLIIIREPNLLLSPRLWGEEGCVFYQFALHHSLYDIFTTAHVGYLTLFNSIVSSIQAKIFSVEDAAIVSTYMGGMIQIIPVYIITFTSHKFWDSPVKKAMAVFMITIITPPELS